MRLGIGRVGVAAVLAAATFYPVPARAESFGGCGFNSQTLRFAGTVAETTACLLRKVKPKGTGASAQPVPAWLAERVTRPVAFTAPKLRAYLQSRGIDPADLGGPIAIGDASGRRYFVIHDTSSPEEPGTSANDFPANIDSPAYRGNRLSPGWVGTSKRVNLIISRDGRSRTFNDWAAARPKAGVKIENRVSGARSVFVHVENVQPRIKPPNIFAWIAPVPGFTAAQEERLALAYVVASARAGRWMIPAYHFNIDEGLPDGHDDPQNVDLASWAAKVAAIEAAVAATP